MDSGIQVDDEEETSFSLPSNSVVSLLNGIPNEEHADDINIMDDQEDASNKLIKDNRAESNKTRTKSLTMKLRNRVLLVLSRSSLFVIGIAILVAGGVLSEFHPYVDNMDYENCSITGYGDVKVSA